MNVTIQKLPKIRVACKRHTGPYEETKGVWEELVAWAAPKGILGPETIFLGVCYDNPQITPADQIRYDACVSLDEHQQAVGDVNEMEVGGRSYAVATHKGPYSSLGSVYDYIYHVWAGKSGKTLESGPCIEIYKNDPQDTAPEDLLTDVYVPLA